jgi:hypothetical protein
MIRGKLRISSPPATLSSAAPANHSPPSTAKIDPVDR